MKTLFKIELPDYTFYGSDKYHDDDTRDYPEIVETSGFEKAINIQRTFENKQTNLKIIDDDGSFTAEFNRNENKEYYGSPVTATVIEGNYTLTEHYLRIEDLNCSEGEINIICSFLIDGITEVFPKNTISISQYPNRPENSEGKIIPIVAGVINKSGGTLTCYRINGYKYVIADHYIKSIESAYKADGTAITSYNLINDATDGRSYIYANNITEDYILINCSGYVDSLGNLIENPTLFLQYFIEDFTQLTPNYISFNPVITVHDERNYKISKILNTTTQLKDLLTDFCLNFNLIYFPSDSGKLTIIRPDQDEVTPVLSFTENDIFSITPEIEENGDIRNEFRYTYNFETKSGSYSSSISGLSQVLRDELAYTWISDTNTAKDVTERFLVFRKNGERKVTITVPLNLYLNNFISLPPFYQFESGGFLGAEDSNGFLFLEPIKNIVNQRNGVSDIVSLQHPQLISNDAENYIITKEKRDYTNNVATLELMLWRLRDIYVIHSYITDGSGTLNKESYENVNRGDSFSVTCTPATNYTINETFLDGDSQGATNTVNLTNVIANHEIQFKLETSYTYFQIGASALTGGTISPSGTVQVLQGNNQSFTAYPGSGYDFQKFVVDGADVTGSATYQFTNVQTNHSITAYFTESTPPAGDRTIRINLYDSLLSVTPSTVFTATISTGSSFTLSIVPFEDTFLKSLRCCGVYVTDRGKLTSNQQAALPSINWYPNEYVGDTYNFTVLPDADMTFDGTYYAEMIFDVFTFKI